MIICQWSTDDTSGTKYLGILIGYTCLIFRIRLPCIWALVISLYFFPLLIILSTLIVMLVILVNIEFIAKK